MQQFSTPTEFVQALAGMMHRGFYWSRTRKLKMGNIKEPLRDALLERHAAGGDPIGLAPIIPGTTTTRTALLDFDSHKGETKWERMTEVAKQVLEAAQQSGLQAMPFRSSGGKGVHLLFAWEQPQDCHSVRQQLREVLEKCDLKPGTSGVSKGTVEVFPKQDGVDADRFGNMWVLPYAKESTALHPDTFNDMGGVVPRMRFSSSVQKREKPVAERASLRLDAPELARVASAAQALKPKEFDYDYWRTIVFAIHDATDGSEAGLELAQWFNDHVCEHDKGREHLSEQVWPYIRPAEGESVAVTAGSLFYHAQQDGWVDETTAPNADGFEDVGTSEQVPTERHKEEKVSITYADLGSIDIDPPAEREWLVKNWLALGVLHMLFSRGGKGKSLLAQQLETAVANGVEWLGIPVESTGSVLGFHCEEDDHEVRRRQHKIFAYHMLTSEEGANGMHLNGRLGENNLLMVYNDKRVGKQTAFYRAVEAEIARIRPRLVVFDNIAQLFGGVENDRAMVTQFANALAGMARRYNCAMLLLGHVAKSDGSEYSGSTAWENVSRVRWFFKPEDDGSAVLSVAKTNIGPEASVRVVWKEGVFVRLDRASQPESYATAEREIVSAIRQLNGEKCNTSQNPRASTYLPRIMLHRGMTTQPERVLTKSLGKLIAKGMVEPDVELWRRPNRSTVFGLVVTDKYVDHNPLYTGEEDDGEELL